jgi:hypothetical protein
MKRKSSPIPPGVTMLYTDPMDYHLTETRLGYVWWWNPDFKDILTLKVRCASILSYKASQSTIDNNKGYLSRKFINSLEMEEKRKNPTNGSRYGYNNPSPFANLKPNITVQQVRNEPMSGIKVVGVSAYLGNKEEILILLPGDYLYVMDMTSFVESIARGDVVNGVLQSEFIWASNGSRINLIRKDSPYHQSLMKTGE